MPEIRYTEDNISIPVQKILTASTSKTICFYGEMGTGKTTLIKAIIRELGSRDTANSPTYGIVNEYFDRDGQLLAYHFDFYRLNDEREALDLGLEDYFDTGVLVLIEWPEMITSLLPDDTLDVFIETVDQNTRMLTIQA
ncbi:MAG: tRNA (adenosine(37)-N6)-threonylcarbamoyltransferase complex ATPase subunit type 1 TsaE [Flavobacteriaceae bacterium]|nr:MAG: tRNA (adenosine(37)-N6)-threonylcarbamoyltransferase complex ATPase subunit type 1 TsaE [Flavobacteriaceae bacterium]